MNEPCDPEPKYRHSAFIYIVMMPKCQSCQAHDNAVSRGDENVYADETGTIVDAAGYGAARGGARGDEKSDFAVG